MANAFKYWYGGKPKSPQTVGTKYTRVTDSKYDPATAGLDFRMVYLNVDQVNGSGILRIRGVRADGDTTAYHDYPVSTDQLITHIYFESRGAKDGPTFFQVKCMKGLKSVRLTTRYSKCAVVRK